MAHILSHPLDLMRKNRTDMTVAGILSVTCKEVQINVPGDTLAGNINSTGNCNREVNKSMLRVVSQCAGLLSANVEYERHSRSEVLVKVPMDTEVVKRLVQKKVLKKVSW